MKHIKTIFISCIFCVLGYVNAQNLELLIAEGLNNNPEIQKFELQYGIISEKVNEANTLPNTEFSLGYFASEPETRTGAQRFKISATQMMPWFGTISARENYSTALADAQFEEVVIAKRKLAAALSQSYYELYENQEKQAILSDNIQLLETYKTMAINAVETGKASSVAVLRLQMRQNDLLQLQQILVQQFLSEQTTLNKLLNRDKLVPIAINEQLGIPTSQQILTTDSLLIHPELIKLEKLYNSVTQSELLNRKESNPMIGFGIDYVNVEKRPNMNFSDNGKDIIMPMVSVSIPIFNQKYKSVSKQNQLQQQELLSQKQQRLNALETLLEAAINNQNVARISYQTQLSNLEYAKDAETILIKNYETGTINFNDVLDIQELQLKFQMNIAESIKQYYLQTTIINYLIQ